MTLIITLVAKDRIVQVSDRRLTNVVTGERREGKNKAVCVVMDNINFATAYTGLAHMGRPRNDDRTDYWLLENLGSIAGDGEPSVERICESLGQRATDALSRLGGDPGIKGLKFILVGYDRENRPFRASVSNIKFRSHDIYDVQDRFRVNVRRFYPWDPVPDIDVDRNIRRIRGEGQVRTDAQQGSRDGGQALEKTRRQVYRGANRSNSCLARESREQA